MSVNVTCKVECDMCEGEITENMSGLKVVCLTCYEELVDEIEVLKARLEKYENG